MGEVYANQKISQPALCQAHRQRHSAAMWRKSVTGKSAQSAGEKNK
jgi:hypothetical protein